MTIWGTTEPFPALDCLFIIHIKKLILEGKTQKLFWYFGYAECRM